jgi:methyl-accepting chemotaxis protein
MQTGSSRAMGAEQASETALEALDRIVSAAEVVGGATAAIAVRMQAQRAELARLREQITEVAAISKRNGEGAGNVAESAREQAEALAGLDTATVALRELSDRLNGYMVRFREIS